MYKSYKKLNTEEYIKTLTHRENSQEFIDLVQRLKEHIVNFYIDIKQRFFDKDQFKTYKIRKISLVQIFNQISFEISEKEIRLLESLYEDSQFKEKIGYFRFLSILTKPQNDQRELSQTHPKSP